MRILDNSNRQVQLVLDSFSSISPLYYWKAQIDVCASFLPVFRPAAHTTPILRFCPYPAQAIRSRKSTTSLSSN
jgi:hypothetical protein